MREPKTVMKRIRLALTLTLLCVACGCTTLAGKEEIGTSQGYYLRIWKKQADASWKVVLDLFNPLPPAPPMPKSPHPGHHP